MYHIFGVSKDFNNAFNTKQENNKNELFIPIKISSNKIFINNNDIILRFDNNIINILNENKLLPLGVNNNLPLILNTIQRNNNKFAFKSLISIEIDGMWNIYNNIQCNNDLSLMVLCENIYELISNLDIFKYLGNGYIFLLSSKRNNKYKIGFNIIGLEGDIITKRKLWFLLCYLPCTLSSNYIYNNNTLNVLCWLSSTIKGWEFELQYYDNNNNNNNKSL
eukprot:195950_1